MKNLIYFIAALLFSFFLFFSSCEKTKKNNGVSKGDFKDLKPLQNKSDKRYYENVYFNIDSLQFEHIKDYVTRLEKSPSNLILYEYLTNNRTSYGIEKDNYLFIGKDSLNEDKIKEYHRQKQAIYRVKHPNIAVIKLYNGSYLVYKKDTYANNEVYLLIATEVENKNVVVYRKVFIIDKDTKGIIKNVEVKKIEILDFDGVLMETTNAIIIKLLRIDDNSEIEFLNKLDGSYLDLIKSEEGKYFNEYYE